uniref:G-rich RNA sequence binding factor 1 n=1 Tax=Scleropages formosus TaxID=113540 RepID=A0A8C9VEP8_SCLFO
PLPEYGCEQREKEHFIVQAKGLPWSCTAEDLSFFSGLSSLNCLDIVGGGVTLVFDAHGRNTGIAYVEFASQEMADQALQKDRERIGNSDAEGLPKAPEQLPTNGGVVKIQGLPYSATEEDVIQFFAGLDIAEDGVTLVFDRKGRSTGIAYVEFTSQEMAAQALEKHRETMGSRYIEVFPSKKSGIRSGYNFYSTGNVAPALGSTNIPSITQHCVHVRGLPFCASGQDIVNFFSPLQLAKICIEYGPDGRASGEADVYFTCHEDAVLAMSRDKACIGKWTKFYS